MRLVLENKVVKVLLKGCLLCCVYVLQDESGTADSSGLDDSSQERIIGPLPRDGAAGCSGDYSSPSYSYSSILNKSDTGEVLSPVCHLIYNSRYPLTSCLLFSPPPQCRLCGLGQSSYDLLFEQSSTNAVHDPGVQKCALQVRKLAEVLLKFYLQSTTFKILL